MVEEDDLDAANCLLNDSNGLYAPRLMVSEVANALWRKTRPGEIGLGKADALVTCLLELQPRSCSSNGVARCDSPRRRARPFALGGRRGGVGGGIGRPADRAHARTHRARGAPLLAVGAMKMEHTVAAPSDGRVARVKFAAGDWVDEGESPVDFDAAPDSA